MGTHYKVFIFDDHLGLLDGRTGEEEAKKVSSYLKENKALVFLEPRYVKDLECIFFELRKDHPQKYKFLYDNVYYSEDCSGSHLKLLKGIPL